MKMSKFYIIPLFIFITCSLRSQVLDTDTSDVVIRRTSKEKPPEFNISDVIVKIDKEKTKHIVRVDIDIPLTTTLKLNVTDSAGTVIMYLINDQTLKPGVYRVKWIMENCNDKDCDYPPGKYLCAFETDQFIYQKDFYIK
jgi:hypothetical protein